MSYYSLAEARDEQHGTVDEEGVLSFDLDQDDA